MPIHKGKIGVEDLELGTSTFTRKGRTGSDITLSQISQVNIPTAYTAKTSTYTVTASDLVVFCDTTTGAFTITLPTASGALHGVVVVRVDSSSNTLTLTSNSAETINGDTADKLFVSRYSVLELEPQAGNWVVVGLRGLVY